MVKFFRNGQCVCEVDDFTKRGIDFRFTVPVDAGAKLDAEEHDAHLEDGTVRRVQVGNVSFDSRRSFMVVTGWFL